MIMREKRRIWLRSRGEENSTMFKSKSKSEQVRDQVREHAKELADKLVPHVETARDKAGPVIADVRTKAAPMIADARDKAGPVLHDAKTKLADDVLPVITAALAAATEASQPYREEAKRRGVATASALKGEVAPEKNKHRFRKFLGLVGLAGVAALIAKSFSDRQATTAWQSSYQPTPATPPAAAPGEPGGKHLDDVAASSPDEALADASEAPHAATDPDHPAEEIHLKKS